MAPPEQYCTPVLQVCRTMQEWAVYWQAAGVIAAIVFGAFGLYKIYQELRCLNEQRQKDASDKETAERLKRTEFFLSQHRRLFDDKELYEVLCLIDDDKDRLADEDMWDKKRKLLVFLRKSLFSLGVTKSTRMSLSICLGITHCALATVRIFHKVLILQGSTGHCSMSSQMMHRNS